MLRVYCESSKNVDLIFQTVSCVSNTAANIPTIITQTVTAHLAMTFEQSSLLLLIFNEAYKHARIKDYFKSALPIHIQANTSLSDEKRMESQLLFTYHLYYIFSMCNTVKLIVITIIVYLIDRDLLTRRSIRYGGHILFT